MGDLGGKLPNGVMMEILSRVPPESLVRFKSVAKSWYALLNDPKFGYSLQNRNVLLKRSVTNNETGRRETRFSFLIYPLAAVDGDDDTSLLVEDVQFSYSSFFDDFPYTNIRGYSHGLVCLLGDVNSVFLYNPVTRELRKLPPSIFLKLFDEGPEISLLGALGFGYDLKSGDFKVVRIVDFVPLGTDLYGSDTEAEEITYLPSRVEVYDLKRDEWREIKTSIPGRVWWSPSFEMYHEGFYYWWAKSEVGRAEIIMSFDMSEEVFSQIPVPESFEDNDMMYRSMGVLNGSIVLLHYPLAGDDEKSFDVWEMVKLGGVVSWSKLFTIGPVLVPEIHCFLAFVGSDQLLMETYPGQLILYNINTKQSKHLTLEGNPGKSIASHPQSTSKDSVLNPQLLSPQRDEVERNVPY